MRLCGMPTAPCWWCASKAALEGPTPRPLFTELRRETVWKITGGFLIARVSCFKRARWDVFVLFWLLAILQIEAYWDFPDSLWKEDSANFAMTEFSEVWPARSLIHRHPLGWGRGDLHPGFALLSKSHLFYRPGYLSPDLALCPLILSCFPHNNRACARAFRASLWYIRVGLR
jgi:hypothetical protein